MVGLEPTRALSPDFWEEFATFPRFSSFSWPEKRCFPQNSEKKQSFSIFCYFFSNLFSDFVKLFQTFFIFFQALFRIRNKTEINQKKSQIKYFQDG
jgi:hypothetical protein